MGPEDSTADSNAPAAAVIASPSGKRNRDPEDEVYVDNLHSHKRYLSEIMASSLNGLTVGDPLSENLVDSTARLESMLYSREDSSLQYSPMSEDSDDSRYFENSTNTCSSQPESVPTSPVSPYRSQKPSSGISSCPQSPMHPASHGFVVSAVASTQARHRGCDNDGRFPSSPSDICHSADLRRAALLRSVQMRAQPPDLSQVASPLSPGHESGNAMEAEDQPCPYAKATVDESENDTEPEEQSSPYAKAIVDGERGHEVAECPSLSRDVMEEVVTMVAHKADAPV